MGLNTNPKKKTMNATAVQTPHKHQLLQTREIPRISPKKALFLFQGTHPKDWYSLGKLLLGGARFKYSGSTTPQKKAIKNLLASIRREKGSLDYILSETAALIGLVFPLEESTEARYKGHAKKLVGAIIGASVIMDKDPSAWTEKWKEMVQPVWDWKTYHPIFHKKSNFRPTLGEIPEDWVPTGEHQILENVVPCPVCRITHTKYLYQLKNQITGEEIMAGAECASQVSPLTPKSDLELGLAASFKIRRSSYYPIEENTLLKIEDSYLQTVWIEYLCLHAERLANKAALEPEPALA